MSQTWETTLAIGLASLLVICALVVLLALVARRSVQWRRVEQSGRQEDREAFWQYKARTVLQETRDGRPRRYEVTISDWGVERGPMRYRWAVWDADRHLVIVVDPEADRMGLEIPFMLGNAPTAPMAEAEALAWVHKQGSDSVVVS